MNLPEELSKLLRKFRKQDGALLSKYRELHNAVLSAIEKELVKEN